MLSSDLDGEGGGTWSSFSSSSTSSDSKSLNSKSTLHKDPWDDDLEEVTVRAFGGARAFLVVMGGEP